MYKTRLLLFVILIFLFSPFVSANKWSGSGVRIWLSVSGGKNDAFITIHVEPLDYTHCPEMNKSKDMAYQCSVVPSFHEDYVLYLNESGIFLGGRYLDRTPVFFYQNDSWIMAETKDYVNYRLYIFNKTTKCFYPLYKNITGQRRFMEIVENSTLRVRGVLENNTIVFSSEKNTWKLPIKEINPYLWLNEESKHLVGMPLNDRLLIYSPLKHQALALKNGSFLINLYSFNEQVSGISEAIKPVSIFIFDGKKLRHVSLLYLIYDVNVKKQSIGYVEELCIKGSFNITKCEDQITNTTRTLTPQKEKGICGTSTIMGLILVPLLLKRRK